MSREQKIALILACVFYAATVFGFFYFSLTLIVLMFMAATISMTYFAYLCYKAHNDYTGAEHLQQEIGLLKAEIEQKNKEFEAVINDKNEEIERAKQSIEELTEKAESAEKSSREAQEELSRNVKAQKTMDNLYESLLPPDDEDAADVDIIAVARRAIAELDEDAKAVGLKVTISSAVEKLIVHASAKRLLIMFRNIIDNSIKYMKKAGTLVVTISTIEDDIFIVLKDTGNGLPENETKHIFELNFQGSNRISGNGLGLTQAKAIVEHYGGTIYARSPQGNGMGIYIQLPTT
ncbi:MULTISPECIES: sensor histidine kinase [unclassified Butyrivibrio]|uniref:sensor histidine kinase n=1 Tax=unclassified Butyrivibrio TaxID=2639466 RepID=UPI0003B3D566|nr:MULTISPECIES: HAMP domain-containing sensor histidine kinase [unclassified Butyrivibrio]MDC7295061.1 HAMP domain-containing histidine kinase [Butyrivibrio sp. DSM 10294]